MSSVRIELLTYPSSGPAEHVLTRRCRELLSFFALRKRPLHRDELAASIWPDLEPKAACNVLQVTVHRIKERFEGRPVIACCRAGYALDSTVVFDIAELERLACDIRGFRVLSPAEVELLEAGCANLQRAGRFADLNEALAPLDDRCRQLAAELAERLAAHHLRSGDVERAISIAEAMLDMDPCDEAGWEIVIRAHLAQRRESDAVRAFRRYSLALGRDLGIAPSDHLRRLLQGVRQPPSQLAS